MLSGKASSHSFREGATFEMRTVLFGVRLLMEQRTFKNVNNCLNTNIYSYLETSGGQSYNL